MDFYGRCRILLIYIVFNLFNLHLIKTHRETDIVMPNPRNLIHKEISIPKAQGTIAEERIKSRGHEFCCEMVSYKHEREKTRTLRLSKQNLHDNENQLISQCRWEKYLISSKKSSLLQSYRKSADVERRRFRHTFPDGLTQWILTWRSQPLLESNDFFIKVT